MIQTLFSYLTLLELEDEASKILSEKDEEAKKSEPNDSVTWKDEGKEEEKHQTLEEGKSTASPKTQPKGNKVHTIDGSGHKRNSVGSNGKIS